MPKVLKRWLSIFSFATITSTAFSASFDCAKAFTQVENAICASSRLSELDAELSRLYWETINRTIDAGGARDEIKDAQNAWLRVTRNTCQDDDCLMRVYTQRIAALNRAKAEYEEAKSNSEDEDNHPPPEDNRVSQAPSAVNQTISANPAQAPIASSPDPQVSSATNAEPTTSDVEKVSNERNEAAIVGIVALIFFFVIWIIAALAISKLKQGRVVSIGGGFIATLLILSLIAEVFFGAISSGRKLAQPSSSANVESVATTSSNRGNVEADTGDWFIVGGEISEALITGKAAMKYGCTPDKGPGKTMDALGVFGAAFTLKDIEVVNGTPTVVLMTSPEGEVYYVRGEKRCARMAANLTANSAAEYSKKQQGLDKYR